MNNQINQESINDAAKLIMHRLIAREIGRDPSLIEKAKVVLGSQGYSFLHDWNDLLDLSMPQIRRLLTSRCENMTRLRLSSPFVVTEGLDFTDTVLRRRIWKAAKRVTKRASMRGQSQLTPMIA